MTQQYLHAFFKAIEYDPRIRIAHIGLYASVLKCWEKKQYTNPLVVFSKEIIVVAKISSPSTYHKGIRDLSDFGYLHYVPSFNRLVGSKIFLKKL